MNDGREPTGRPGDEPAGGDGAADPWIIIDDATVELPDPSAGAAFDAPRGTVPSEQHEVTPQTPPPRQPQSAPRGHGWDSFASTESWNGMQVAPPGTTPGAGGAEPVGRPAAGTTQSASGWGARADGIGQDDSGQTMEVEGTWFMDGGDDDGSTGTARTPRMGRLPHVEGLALTPGIVTLTVIFLGALLVVSSIIWHPHAP
jgi:hypothetical protein